MSAPLLCPDLDPATTGHCLPRETILEKYASHFLESLAAVHGSPEERESARSSLAALLATDTGHTVFGDAVPALLKALDALSPKRESLSCHFR